MESLFLWLVAATSMFIAAYIYHIFGPTTDPDLRAKARGRSPEFARKYWAERRNQLIGLISAFGFFMILPILVVPALGGALAAFLRQGTESPESDVLWSLISYSVIGLGISFFLPGALITSSAVLRFCYRRNRRLGVWGFLPIWLGGLASTAVLGYVTVSLLSGRPLVLLAAIVALAALIVLRPQWLRGISAAEREWLQQPGE